MKITELKHVGVCVSDLEKSVDFYTEFMGFEIKEPPSDPIDDEDESFGIGMEHAVSRVALLELKEMNFVLELIQFLEPEASAIVRQINAVGKHHIAYEVDDIFAWYKKWQEASLRVYYHPALAFGYDEEDAFYWLYVDDPDGIAIELTQSVKKAQ